MFGADGASVAVRVASSGVPGVCGSFEPEREPSRAPRKLCILWWGMLLPGHGVPGTGGSKRALEALAAACTQARGVGSAQASG